MTTPDYANPVTDIVAPASKDDQNMGLLMFILGIFTGFLGPLILWLVKKTDSRYLDAQGKEVLNFQITTILAMLVNIPLWFIIIGVFIHFALIITYLVLMIIGAVTASKGNFYRFPFALRLLK
jgi:uncharacterized Tic20 family protein